MLCSVIVPLYNKESYVVNAINSILRQTYQHFEVIVVNDGSTDRSVESVESIQDSRVRIINQTNGGVSRARNRGIEEARGDLIFFLDADDWYDKFYLKTVISMAEEYPTGTFFATDYKHVLHYQPDEWDSIEPLIATREPIIDFYKSWLGRCGTLFCTNTVAVRKSDLMKLQPCFPLNESLGEDQDVWFRLAERLELVYCPVKLASYRLQVAGSLCDTNKLNVLPPVFLRLESRAKKGLLKKSSRSSALLLVAWERISVARYLLSTGNRRPAFTELRKGFRGAILKRWWSTLFICCFGSSTMMKKWEHFRMIDKSSL